LFSLRTKIKNTKRDPIKKTNTTIQKNQNNGTKIKINDTNIPDKKE
jgi:hypothetical protein